jgi:hypothetical protein
MQGSLGSILQDAADPMKHLNNIFPNKISIELPKVPISLLLTISFHIVLYLT